MSNVDWYRPKYNRFMNILIPRTRYFLDEHEGWGNKWKAREGSEFVLDGIIELSRWEKIKLAWDIIRY